MSLDMEDRIQHQLEMSTQNSKVYMRISVHLGELKKNHGKLKVITAKAALT